MKTKILILTAVCVSGLLLPTCAQTTTNMPEENSAAPLPSPSSQAAMPPGGSDMENAGPDSGAPNAVQDQTAPEQGAMNGQPETPAQPAEAAPAESQSVQSTVILPRGNAPKSVPSAFPAPGQAVGKNPNDLNMNFNNAPLNMVLSYLSDAAGFMIVQETPVSGTVTVIGNHLTQDQAVDLLNTELNRNGYAAVRDGQMLTIMTKSDAKTQNIPVKTGNDPNAIPDNDEIATWIIPIRFVEAQQLVSDLSSFVSPQATIVANQAGNSIVVTDTQSNIRHLAKIIQAVDNSAETETEIRVFPLKYANPTDVANELSSIFPNSGNSGNNMQAPFRFGGGGRGGFFARMAAQAAAGGNSSQNERIQKETQVTAVADTRIQAVIVTAPKDLMEQIASMMTDLDVASPRDQKVYVYHLDHGDPNEVAQVLQDTFGGNNSRASTSSTSQDALQSRANAAAQAAGNNQSSSSTSTFGGGVGNSRANTGGNSF